ncbi:hypothetical protein ACQP3D_29030, partial [Escherichia coli]
EQQLGVGGTRFGWRQVDFCEFKASLLYRMSSRTDSKTIQSKPVSKNCKTPPRPEKKKQE